MQGAIIGARKVKHIESKIEIQDVLTSMLDHMRKEGKVEIPDKARIMVKPNICLVRGWETGATVNPYVVECLIQWMLDNYDVHTIVIGEADSTALRVDMAFEALGWTKLARSYPKVTLLNLSKDERVMVKVDGLHLKKLEMSRTYMESDFLVSVGKLKTHSMCKMSCILKNQFGANPLKQKTRYHKHLSKVIHDLNRARLPDLCVVDGIIGMEENGPIDGIPNPAGILVVGDDPVAVDHICASIMGIEPSQVSYLNLAIKHGLGKSTYETFGDNIADLRVKFKQGTSMWVNAIRRVHKVFNAI